MALTPEDVRNKQFATVRLREGYDLDEVDGFLDEIESTFAEYTKEIADLRATSRGEIPASIREELSNAADENTALKAEVASLRAELETAHNNAAQQSAEPQVVYVPAEGNDAATEELSAKLVAAENDINATKLNLAAVTDEKDSLLAKVAELDAALASARAATPVVETSADHSNASVRLLELAQRTADEHISTALAESETMVTKARSESEQMVNEAKTTVANLTREFENQRVGLERRIEELRAYEREYRSRLRSYLEGQLRELEVKNLGGDREITG